MQDLAPFTEPHSPRPNNLILDRLPEDQYEHFAPHLMAVDLPLGMRLSLPNEPVEYLYFPVSGMVSVDALTHHGETVEVGVIGREGFAGAAGLLSDREMAHAVLMQSAGAGFRLRTGIAREVFERGGPGFATLVHQFLYLQIAQISQSVLCNRLHEVEARLARWLLNASDRIGTDVLLLTQEYLAQMLGSRRSTVTVAAGDLQRAGFIDYSRGRIRILDRTGLEARACECYRIVRVIYERELGVGY